MNFRSSISLISLSLAILMNACIDPFEINDLQESSNKQLVVEGILSNSGTPQIVRLSFTSEISTNTGFEPIGGATVCIKDDQNNCFDLIEFTRGTYVTDTVIFKPQIGRSYQLYVSLSNGITYNSDFQKLEEVSEIDSLSVKVESEPILSGGQVGENEKINIYSKIKGGQNKYVRYEYAGTYEYRSAFQGRSFCWPSEALIPIDILPLSDTITCYRNEEVRLPLNVYSFDDVVAGQAFNQKVISITTDRRFYLGYSMLVKKYAISESFFRYLSDIKEQNSFGGDLFAPPPTTIVGNISEVNNQENRALGFFGTASMTQKRIFIFPDNLPIGEIPDPTNLGACPIDLRPEEESAKIRPPIECCDCRLDEDAIKETPDFWPIYAR